MELTPEQIAELQAKAKQADEMAAKLKEIEGKAKGYEEVKADMLRYKEQLAATKAAEEAAERERLTKQGEYKTLLEKAEAEKGEWVKKATDAQGLAEQYIRFSAVKDEATKAGLRPEAMRDLQLLNLNKLEIQREGNDIQVKGAVELVAEQKKNRPHWFADGTPPKFDAGKGDNKGDKNDANDLVALHKKDPAAYRAALEERIKAGVKA